VNDSYSLTPDKNSSSQHDFIVCVLNETQNVDLTTERENRKPNSRKEREAFNQNGIEIKPNCYEIQDTQTETLKKVLKYQNGRYVLLWGNLYTEIFF